MKKIVKSMVWLIFSFLVMSLTAIPAKALPIWGSDASGELIGGRTSPAASGVDATQQWDNGGFTLDWAISQGDDDLWTYIYDVTGDTKGISHLILEVTEDDDPFIIYDGTSLPYEGPVEWSLSRSNPLMPNPIYGVKFDFGDTIVRYTMITDRAPVYGVFYAKDGTDGGVDVVAWSNALNSSDYKTNEVLTVTDFIVRPDGITSIPDPAAVFLLGSACLIGFAAARRKFIK